MKRSKVYALATVVSLLICQQLGCSSDPPARQLGKDWMRKGKLAGLAIYPGMSDADLAGELDALVAQHVDIVVADSSLSNYKTELQFDTELSVLARVSREAHARGLRVVWYLTTLEVQTVDGKNRSSTMAKDHPDWLQVGLSGKQNVFYGGQEDWVEATDESAWMCPISGFRDYFFARVRKLASSGIDGIWADVPLFMDTGVKWNCYCEHHQQDFKAKSGHALPAKEDWNDPIWRQWINYRHHDINDFLLGIHRAAREENPEFEVVIEVFTADYNDAMDKGLDGSFTGNVEGLSKAWEIDSVSNGQGMLWATADDWMMKIAMTKFARGADKGRPTWVFSYGNSEWDAQMVMAIAFAAQANPYETRTPNMADSVGEDFRQRMYAWADNHIDAIYDTTPSARVALLYSSLSRDYLDHHYGFAMYSSVEPPIIDGSDPKTGASYTGADREWWSKESRDSVDQLEFLGEYRGMVKALAHLHVPFVIETMQKLTLADVARYETLIAPSLGAIDDAQAEVLREYVRQGGNLIVTGLDPLGLDGLGTARAKRALQDVLGFDAEKPGDGVRSRHFGAGSVHTLDGLPARSYLRSGSATALDRIRGLLAATSSTPLSTDADKMVHLETYAGDKELVVHAINLVGVDGSGSEPRSPQQVRVTLELPADRKATGVRVSSPDHQTKDAELQLEAQTPGQISFTMPVEYYALARVALAEAPTHGSLEIEIAWPTKATGAPRLGAMVRVDGSGMIGPRTRHADWGEQPIFEGLPAGEKHVEIVIVDDGYQPVGRQSRVIQLEVGKAAKLSAIPGVSSAGPTKLEAREHDTIFFVNDGAAPVALEAGATVRQLAPGAVASLRLDDPGDVAYTLGAVSGSVSVLADESSSYAEPVVDKISHSEGFAGHSVVFSGRGFGTLPGKVLWGSDPCTVTYWSPDKVTAYLPHQAPSEGRALVVEVDGRQSAPLPFKVLAPDIALDEVMKSSFAFVRDKMRSPQGGVYTNLKDRVDPPDAAAVYPYGHHQTAEHMGLLLWASAALLEHQTFDESYQFVRRKMLSPRRDVVNWAIHKTTGEPMVQREDPSQPWLNSNAPLDDFRVLKGMIAGWMQWKDERYLATALRIGRGLYETSVSQAEAFPDYPDGLVAYAYNWPELGGLGVTDVGVIPIDYADLWTMRWLADHDPRWKPVIRQSVRLMEAAQIPSSGQYYNSYLQASKELSGDFEFRETMAGQKIKAIQSLWIAIHLARVGRTASAQQALEFYKQLYTTRGRIAEYLNPDGSEVTESYFDASLFKGEVRIYSQAARLAYYLGDTAFGDKLIAEKIVPDRDANAASPTYGNLGVSTAAKNDAEGWNNLESLLGLAIARGSKVVNGVYTDDSGL